MCGKRESVATTSYEHGEWFIYSYRKKERLCVREKYSKGVQSSVEG